MSAKTKMLWLLGSHDLHAKSLAHYPLDYQIIQQLFSFKFLNLKMLKLKQKAPKLICRYDLERTNIFKHKNWIKILSNSNPNNDI